MTAPKRTATEMARPLPLSSAARDLLDERSSPDDYLARLDRHGLYTDAYLFLAHWLPRREAVWWGCQCAWHVFRPMPPEPDAAGLVAAVHWVLDPSDANRRAVEAAAAAGEQSTGGELARAAGEEPDPASAQRIAGAVLRLAAVGPEDQAEERRRLFLRLGLELAHGRNRWE